MTESSLIPCKRTPIWNNPDILLNNNMINFTDWSCKGIKYLEHIFEGTDFIPFDKLIKQYGINKNRFLEYQQIKSIVKGNLSLIISIYKYHQMCQIFLISKPPN